MAHAKCTGNKICPAQKKGAIIHYVSKKAMDIHQLGADIIDIGGESTKPYSKSIDYNIEIKRVTFNDQIMPQVFDRMASEQEAEAAKFECQGKAKRSEILGIINRDVDQIISRANKEARIIEGVADSTSAALYANTYNVDTKFYELWKTFDILPDAIGSKSTFWLSTQNYPNSNIFGTRPNVLK